MRVTSIATPAQRPQIKRMTQQELQEIRYSNEYESPSVIPPFHQGQKTSIDSLRLIHLVDESNDQHTAKPHGPRSARIMATDLSAAARTKRSSKESEVDRRRIERGASEPIFRRDQCLQNRAWFWVFGGVFCLILVIAVVAIVLGIVLRM